MDMDYDTKKTKYVMICNEQDVMKIYFVIYFIGGNRL